MGYSQYDLVWMGKSRSLQLSLVCLIDREGTIYAEKQKQKNKKQKTKKKTHRNRNELERILAATLFRVQVLSFLKNISFLSFIKSSPKLCHKNYGFKTIQDNYRYLLITSSASCSCTNRPNTITPLSKSSILPIPTCSDSL